MRPSWLPIVSASAILALGTAGHAHDWVGLAFLVAVIVMCERALFVRARRARRRL